MSGFNCCFLTCIQISQEASKVVWYSHLFKNFPVCLTVIYTIKSFSVVIEAEVGVFLKFSCFFCDPTDVGNLISGSSAFSKSGLYIWKFSVHILLKPSLEDFVHDLASMWNECSCVVGWTFLLPLMKTASCKYSPGLPRWCSGKESACQCRRCKIHSFNPWVGKIPWSRKWQPTPVFLLEKSHWQRSLAGYSPCRCKGSDMT